MSNRRKIKSSPAAPPVALPIPLSHRRYNGYICGGGSVGAAFRAANHGLPDEPFCGRTLITVDRDEGVTPMFLSCPFCPGRMASMGYPSGPPPREPDVEWRTHPGRFGDERDEVLNPHWLDTAITRELGKTPESPLFGGAA